MIIIQDYSTSKPELDIKTREKMQYWAARTTYPYTILAGPLEPSISEKTLA